MPRSRPIIIIIFIVLYICVSTAVRRVNEAKTKVVIIIVMGTVRFSTDLSHVVHRAICGAIVLRVFFWVFFRISRIPSFLIPQSVGRLIVLYTLHGQLTFVDHEQYAHFEVEQKSLRAFFCGFERKKKRISIIMKK